MSYFMISHLRSIVTLLVIVVLASGCSSSSQSETHAQDNIIGGPDTVLITSDPLQDDVLALPSQPLQVSVTNIALKTLRIQWQFSSNTQFYRVLENPDGISGFTKISGDIVSSTRIFDHSIALYQRVNARYIVQACNTNGCIDSTELYISGSLAEAIGYVKASNTDSNDSFGTTVDLSADGNTLVIGAPGEGSSATGVNGNQDDNLASEAIQGYGSGAGAVYVFQQVNGNWLQQAYVKASNTDRSDQFGGSLSLSGDGNTLVVGASYERSNATQINGNENDNSLVRPGAAYVFVRTNAAWTQQAYLKASNAETDLFGTTVSLNSDGNTLAVAAPYEEGGVVYIFARTNDIWIQQTQLRPESPDSSLYGIALGLDAAGNTLAVGASDSDGTVFVYERSGSAWSETAFLQTGSDQARTNFGNAVSLSADGRTLAIGAKRNKSTATGVNGRQSDDNELGAGAAYIYVRSGDEWLQQAFLKASNTSALMYFGEAVSLSADGNTVAVSGIGDGSIATGINGDEFDNPANFSGGSAGAVFVFVRLNGSWQQQAYVKASNTSLSDRFGGSVSLGGNGNIMAVGAVGEDSAATGIGGFQGDNSATDSGAVYLY